MCADSSNWSATLDPWVQPLIALFCYAHVCARSSNWSCACPQQQLLGQLLTFGCRPQLPYSATHMCVCAHNSKWFVKAVDCSKPSIDYLHLLLLQHTCVCVCSQQHLVVTLNRFTQKHTCVCHQQQVVGQPLALCVLTIAIGRPNLK